MKGIYDDGWESNENAAFEEACRRIERFSKDLTANSLDFSDLRSLKHFPDTIRSLTGLQQLDCSNTNITSLEPLSGMTSLVELYCHNNELTDDGFSPIRNLIGLQQLDCSNIKISSLEPLSRMTSLSGLFCSNNELKDEGFTPIRSLTGLQQLDCSNTKISSLEPLSRMTSLSGLFCSNKELKDEGFTPIRSLTGLQQLDCSNTNITSLEPLSGMTSLVELYCAGNELTDEGFTPIRNLIGLQQLDCSNIKISSLEPLSRMTSLSGLFCSNNELTDEGFTPIRNLIGLQMLYCSGTKITSLEPLSAMTSLVDLYYADNELTDEGFTPIRNLIGLQMLYCSGTKITSLEPLSGMNSLVKLYCANIELTDEGFTPIRNLIGLQKLDCSRNNITSLEPLSAMTSLVELRCNNNKLTDEGFIPIHNLTSLQKLDCSRNNITSLEPLIKLNLLELNISGCILKYNPNFFTIIRELKVFEAFNATIPGVPAEVLSFHDFGNLIEKVLAHFVDLGEAPETWNSTKLMVLGNGRIGKTQICNRLCKLDFDSDANSTHGITLTTENIGDENYIYNIWDFGGQDIYYGTHALFLKSQAIFLLVWTPESDNSETHTDNNGMIFRNQSLAWWLHYVKRFGGKDSPLIVVQNQIDIIEDNGDHPAVLDFRQSVNPRFCRSMGYSAKEAIGHATLLDNIHQARQKLNTFLIGPGRLNVIENLREKRNHDLKRTAERKLYRHISYSDFEKICDNASGKISDTRIFLDFLHNAGEVFWREGLFNNNIILDQDWLLEAIYTIFNRESCVTTLRRQEGQFSRELLEILVWQEKKYTKTEQQLFVAFMKTSGICFGIGPSDSEILIAPDYLPEIFSRRSLVDFEAQAEEVIEYESLPPTLIRNIITHIGKYAGVAAEYWKHGAFYYDDVSRSKVMIEQHCDQNWSGKITIKSAGGDYQKSLKNMLTLLESESQRLGVSPIIQKIIEEVEEEEDISPGSNPEQKAEYYISYAWGIVNPCDDNSGEENELTNIADKFCMRAKENGFYIHRDKNEMKFNDSIRLFMQRLIKGDRIIIILSDKYLESEACMYELSGIWKETSTDKGFLEKVRVYVHSSAKIKTAIDRAKITEYWEGKYKEEVPFLEHFGEEDRIKNLALKKFLPHLGDILTLLSDTLLPRNLEDLINYSFDD